MKAAFISEFMSVRAIVIQSLVVFLVFGVFLCAGMQTAVGMVAAIGAMTPLIMVFSFSAYDNLNGWERFRAMLPLSRNAIVVSRYANILATALFTMLVAFALSFALASLVSAAMPGSALANALAEETARPIVIASSSVAGTGIGLLMAAFLLPAVLRFGMNKAMRYVPTAIFVVFMLLALALPNFAEVPPIVVNIGTWLENPNNLPIAIVAVAALTLGVYAVSCGVALALYRSKDL